MVNQAKGCLCLYFLLCRCKSSTLLTPADTYNGALRDTYAWSQTLKDVDIKVFVPSNVKTAKQLTVEIKPEYVKVMSCFLNSYIALQVC